MADVLRKAAQGGTGLEEDVWGGLQVGGTRGEPRFFLQRDAVGGNARTLLYSDAFLTDCELKL